MFLCRTHVNFSKYEIGKCIFDRYDPLFRASNLPTSCSKRLSDPPASLPNVVLINVDDWGWQDYGVKNPQWFNTPNIDAFSEQSLLFTNAYAGAANCAPSRACLLSGMNTPRHGVYTVSPSDRGNEKTRKIIPTVNTRHLPDSVVLLPELFQMKGYVTASMGKWHVSKDPFVQGVNRNIAGGPNGNPGKNGYFSPYNVPNIEDGPVGEYLTDRITQEAVTFIKQHRDTSFFLYLPYYAVHTPLLPKPEVYEKNIKTKRDINTTNSENMPLWWKRWIGISGVSYKRWKTAN